MKNAHPYADFTHPLTRAHQISLDWLNSLDTRAVTPSTDVETILAKLGELPEHPGDPSQTIEHLAAAVARAWARSDE